jgi:hypothetical protein
MRVRMTGVREVRHASEDEVILAFLAGELASARFGDDVRAALDTVGGIDLLTAPDLGSHTENQARRTALGVARGWGADERLFAGFPSDVAWVHGVLDVEELERVRYIDYSYWVELSGGSRRPVDVRDTVARGELPEWLIDMGTSWCGELAQILATGTTLGDLIIVGTPDHDELVVLEGHARLTGLFVGGLQRRLTVTAYVGVSPKIHEWTLF